ncbi:hypothetical protein E0H80_07795 [Acinetobacter sp. ANC 4779]|uniref:hypothetical protein n=1 Tax=Acinetobacter sp. ANC 4779 TaxID=2529848 RepID=UPI001039A423|nr:hypothetical protein [Acinetobacter sp. ANC 4779]TCB50720.1 hypothetical protein E0H80_07795 [Acinetobacter sp. ANC 4779]
MNLTYKYLYTRFHVFGSLPTHKVFKSETGNQSKLVFADQSFIYGVVSNWTIDNTHFDGCKSTWQQESEFFLDKEKEALILYRLQHPQFKTEAVI